jgi:hypothetical protein
MCNDQQEHARLRDISAEIMAGVSLKIGENAMTSDHVTLGLQQHEAAPQSSHQEELRRRRAIRSLVSKRARVSSSKKYRLFTPSQICLFLAFIIQIDL